MRSKAEAAKSWSFGGAVPPRIKRSVAIGTQSRAGRMEEAKILLGAKDNSLCKVVLEEWKKPSQAADSLQEAEYEPVEPSSPLISRRKHIIRELMALCVLQEQVLQREEACKTDAKSRKASVKSRYLSLSGEARFLLICLYA